eukprot:TRINITY_DN11015_c0_g1_i1.p1 TRINITY_DN11015_c0_g1~~TRINITY_DN11015_c0_g1_i1.p1  ORF type:complete len:575 (+),score=155.75 TRINITY_DN11015_c0_g1_i1:85-1725(+)
MAASPDFEAEVQKLSPGRRATVVGLGAAAPGAPAVPKPPTVGGALRTHGFMGSELDLDELEDAGAVPEPQASFANRPITPKRDTQGAEHPQGAEQGLGMRSISVDWQQGQHAQRAISAGSASCAVHRSAGSAGSRMSGPRGSMLGVDLVDPDGRQPSILEMAKSDRAIPTRYPSVMQCPRGPGPVLIADAGCFIAPHLIREIAQGAPVRAWTACPESAQLLGDCMRAQQWPNPVEVFSGPAEHALSGCRYAVLCLEHTAPGVGSVAPMIAALKGQDLVRRVVCISDAFAQAGPGGGGAALSELEEVLRRELGPRKELCVLVPPHMVVGAPLCDGAECGRAALKLKALSECAWWCPFAPRMAWVWTPASAVAASCVGALYSTQVAGRRFELGGRCLDMAEAGRLIRSVYPDIPAPTTAVPDCLTRAVVSLLNEEVKREDLAPLGRRWEPPAVDTRAELGVAADSEEELSASVEDALSELMAVGFIRPAAPPPRLLSLLACAAASAGAAAVAGRSAALQLPISGRAASAACAGVAALPLACAFLQYRR